MNNSGEKITSKKVNVFSGEGDKNDSESDVDTLHGTGLETSGAGDVPPGTGGQKK